MKNNSQSSALSYSNFITTNKPAAVVESKKPSVVV